MTSEGLTDMATATLAPTKSKGKGKAKAATKATVASKATAATKSAAPVKLNGPGARMAQVICNAFGRALPERHDGPVGWDALGPESKARLARLAEARMTPAT
jgi:hypothetical protein